MTIVERRIRSLRVRAPDDDRARHAAIVVEDALRTASLPGTRGSRLVVIRRLDLGGVPVGASSASVSLVVEAAAQRAASSAVHGDSATAADAHAVYFRDDTEPVLTLARRVARNEPASEWFWPLVVRGWAPSVSSDRSAALLFQRAWESSAGVVAMAQVVAIFAVAGAIGHVIDSMSEGDARSLLALVGWRDLSAGARPRDVEVPGVSRPMSMMIRECVDRWGGATTDARTTFVAAMLLVAERPSRASSAMLPAIVRAVIESVARGDDAGGARDGGVAETRRAASGGDESIAGEWNRWQERRESTVDSVFGGGPPRPISRLSPPPPTPESTSELVEPTSLEPPFWGAPRRSAFAGALFLIPLLSRLDIATLVADNADLAERSWPETLIARVTTKLGADLVDPALAWLTLDSLHVASTDRALTATWIRAARARCRRDTGAGLAALVRRSGAIAVTRTHIDVLFRYSQVDIAVRRAGIDIDPGWVPWLGRVVQFHYLDELPDDAA